MGKRWFLHLDDGEKDTRFQPNERSFHWREGEILDVLQTTIKVKVFDKPLDPTVKDFPNQSSCPNAYEIREVPYCTPDISWTDLMQKAQAELRCVDWSAMTFDFIASGPKVGSFNVSRPVHSRERVDFFITHSWHDEAAAKYEAIHRAATKFIKQKGREPTFWLDKACINQDAISDGLRCLPVNLMACSQVLLACGPSYQYRLWCIWELFTLMAFTTEELVLEKLILQPLASHTSDVEERMDIAYHLRVFDLDAACCYDPNEEARLKGIITSMGRERFEARIHWLGRSLEIRLCTNTTPKERSELSRASVSSSAFLTASTFLTFVRSNHQCSVRAAEEHHEEDIPIDRGDEVLALSYRYVTAEV